MRRCCKLVRSRPPLGLGCERRCTGSRESVENPAASTSADSSVTHLPALLSLTFLIVGILTTAGTDRGRKYTETHLRGIFPHMQPPFWGWEQGLGINNKPQNPVAGQTGPLKLGWEFEGEKTHYYISSWYNRSRSVTVSGKHEVLCTSPPTPQVAPNPHSQPSSMPRGRIYGKKGSWTMITWLHAN